MNYNAAYFIAKFEAIPEGLWCTNDFSSNGAHCARGHCGESHQKETDESKALVAVAAKVIGNGLEIAEVNDGDHRDYKQSTPKERVLALLKDAQEAGL
jgi:hypothetical protein